MPDREICRRRVLSEDYRDFILSGSKGFREEFSEEDLCRIPLEYTFQIAFLENEGENGRSRYRFPYYSIPKCYTLLDMEVLDIPTSVRVMI